MAISKWIGGATKAATTTTATVPTTNDSNAQAAALSEAKTATAGSNAMNNRTPGAATIGGLGSYGPAATASSPILTGTMSGKPGK